MLFSYESAAGCNHDLWLYMEHLKKTGIVLDQEESMLKKYSVLDALSPPGWLQTAFWCIVLRGSKTAPPHPFQLNISPKASSASLGSAIYNLAPFGSLLTGCGSRAVM